mgnify:CR=1 FL=1
MCIELLPLSSLVVHHLTHRPIFVPEQEEGGGDEGEISYMFNGKSDGGGEEDGGGAQTGAEVVEGVILQFKEMEWVSIEDPLHVKDMDSLRSLKDVSMQISEMRRGNA